MKPSRVAREQQIAIFGESGSGKTVLLSSFYGRAQEQALEKASLFDVIAEDTSQHLRLHQNYLGMKNSATAPMTTRFSATRYAFLVRRRPTGRIKASRANVVEDLRLVWHDYPGEWFEEEPATTVEQTRRVDTFRALLGADVALLVVDGQLLLDNRGEEERYLKALMANYRTHLARLRDDLLPDGKQLVRFPRIWLFALSKADLLPDMNVDSFGDLLVEKSGAEISSLEAELASFVEEPDAMSVGEDFVILSSAKFKPKVIEVSQTIGLNLILPIAAVLPFSRHLQWVKVLRRGSKVAKDLTGSTGPLLALLVTKVKLPGVIGVAAAFVLPHVIEPLTKLANNKVENVHDEAAAKHDFLTAVLTGFQVDLDRATEQKVLRSLR